MDGGGPVKVLMITKVVNLESVFGICEGTWALLQDAVDDILVRIPQFPARKGDTEKPAAVDSALTVDIHRLAVWVLEKRLHRALEL